MRDGLTYDAIQYLFDNFEVAGAIKRASIMKDRSGNYDEIYPYVKEWAIKHGITLFEKHRGLTFIKKDGMMQSLVNYLKDVNPKTKSGFLDYINSRGDQQVNMRIFGKQLKNLELLPLLEMVDRLPIS